MGALIVMNHAVSAFDILNDTDETFTATATPTDPKGEVIECLKTYKAIDEASAEMNSNNFETLRSVLSRYTEHGEAEEFLSKSEIEWIETSFSADKIQRFKDGKIKITKHLPGSYSAAKSVLLGALKNGIAFYDADGEPVGKTALQNANKAASKTPEEKIAAMMESVMKMLPQCADPEAMRKTLQEIVA